MEEKRHISTTALSKELDIPLKELFSILAAKNWIEKKENYWALTLVGIENGGQFVDHSVYGKYITWPCGTSMLILGTSDKNEFMTATDIGKSLDVSARRINAIFSELGWIKREHRGWVTTDVGTRSSGIQRESSQTGKPYVIWHKTVKENNLFLSRFKELKGFDASKIVLTKDSTETHKEEQYRTADGHYVKSAEEVIIDNWLYMAAIVHAYGRKLPVEKSIYSSFYIPTENVYVEYTGNEEEQTVRATQQKIDAYKKHKLKLIELNESDLKNLDNALPKKLLDYDIHCY